MTSIEWVKDAITGAGGLTWNPITGCLKASPGCLNCYAERIALKLKRQGIGKYKEGFCPMIHWEELEEKRLKKTLGNKGKTVFVCSMSDLFQPGFEDFVIFRILEVLQSRPLHTFILLTKRIDRLSKDIKTALEKLKNIWLGVSVENKEYLWRIEELQKINVKTKFISFEPLLGSIPEINLKGIKWVIAGAETGPNIRPMAEEWVREIKDQCVDRRIPFFYKQRITREGKKEVEPFLDGQKWLQMPGYYEKSL